MQRTRLKGGSLSGTYLCVAPDGRRFVRKEVSLVENREYGFQRWYSQLKRMQRYEVLFPGLFPSLTTYGRDGDRAYFDMAYVPDAVTVHEFLVTTTDLRAIDALFAELVRVTDPLYARLIPSTPDPIDLYIYEEIEQKMRACRGNARFDRIASFPTLVFNGVRCPGLASQLDAIRELARRTYRRTTESFSHGNLTLENILYQPATNHITLIDPYEENVIDSPLADYSQVLQSCNSKYELYNALSPTLHDDHIDLTVPVPPGLAYFRAKFVALLAERFTSDELTAIRLLEVSQYARMLPFKMEIDEDKMVFFYGLGSYLLHELRSEARPMTTSTTPVREWTIDTQQPVRFKIKSSPGIFDPANGDLVELGSQGASARRFLVIDRHICQWYLPAVTRYFQARSVEVHILAIDATENDKNLEVLLLILRELEKFGVLRRDEPVIAIGGGVLLDVVGMAAGMYRRGVPYIRVPTTLVGLVDASVGAKTGINFENRRNRLGSYYPPIAAYLDRAFLRTLEPIEISSGLGEILKMAVIKDARLFALLEGAGRALVDSKFEHPDADEVIDRAVAGMKVENNLWETDLRRIVDFGHSFSPIIEMRSIHQAGLVPLTHGQAVTLDVLYSCVLSANRGLLPPPDVRRVAAVAHAMGLPTSHQLFATPLILLEALKDTMTHRNGNQNLPIPMRIGEATFVNDLTYDEIRAAVPHFVELGRHARGAA